MKIELTGATGFVGTNLKAYLRSSFEVFSVSARYNPNQTFEINGSGFIHLAGKAHDLKKVADPQEYYEANFELTKQVFDAFILSEATVFIFLSSVKAVADEVSGILTEENRPNPKTHYGISKFQAENYIFNQKLPKGKRIYILRPCMIHGVGNKGNLNLLYSVVKKGYPWPLAAFKNQRSFLSIENLCFVIKELLGRTDIPSGIFNVADDDSLSTNELIGIISKVQNKSPRIFAIPKKLISHLARIGDVLHLPLNTERLQKLTESFLVSNEKIINAMGKPLPISVREGFEQTFKSFSNA